jgi:hypothetical protein
MATQNASLSAARATIPQSLLKGNQQDGELRVFRSVYNDGLTLTLSIADVISWGYLPKGGVIIGGYMTYTAGTASCTANVGDLQSAARYLAATAINAAGVTSLQPPVNITNAATGGYEVATPAPGLSTDDSEIRSVIAGAGSPATQRIVLVLFYVANN